MTLSSAYVGFEVDEDVEADDAARRRPEDLAERSPRAFEVDEPGVALPVYRAEPWVKDEGPATAPTLVLIRILPAGGGMSAWVDAGWYSH